MTIGVQEIGLAPLRDSWWFNCIWWAVRLTNRSHTHAHIHTEMRKLATPKMGYGSNRRCSASPNYRQQRTFKLEEICVEVRFVSKKEKKLNKLAHGFSVSWLLLSSRQRTRKSRRQRALRLSDHHRHRLWTFGASKTWPKSSKLDSQDSSSPFCCRLGNLHILQGWMGAGMHTYSRGLEFQVT